jgi:hypothetical protein
MKVCDLVAELSKLDQSLEVCCYSEDAFASTGNNGVRAFDIMAVSATSAHRVRDSKGLPTLDILDAEHTRKVALIEISGE